MATNSELTKALQGKKVESVRVRADELDIDFEDGTTFSVELKGEGTYSVEK